MMLEDLPWDVMKQICKYLDVKEWLSMGGVCQKLVSLLGDEYWRRLCVKKFLLMRPCTPLSQVYGGWKFVYFWKRQWYLQKVRRPSDTSILVDLKGYVNEALQEKSKYHYDARLIRPALERELLPFLLSFLEDPDEWQKRIKELILVIKKNPNLKNMISLYIQNEPLPRLVLQYKILFACSSYCLPTVPIIAVMQNLYSQSLYEKQLPSPETLILLKLISAVLDLVDFISEVNVRGINSVHLLGRDHRERKIAMTYGALMCRSWKHSEYYLELLQRNMYLHQHSALDDYFRIAAFAMLCYAHDQDHLLGNELIIKLMNPVYKMQLAIVTFLVRAVAKFGEIFDELFPVVTEVYKMAPQQIEFFYHGIPHPWLRVTILQFLRAHSSSKLNILSDSVMGILEDILSETKEVIGNVGHYDQSAINSVFSIFFEGVKLANHLSSTNLKTRISTIMQLAKRNVPKDFYGVRHLLNHFVWE